MLEFLKRYGVAVLSGALMAAAFPSMGLWFFAWVAFAPLLFVTRATTPRTAAAQFMLAGWVFHLMVLSWLGGNVHWAGGWALVGWFGLAAYMALYWAAIGACWPWLNRTTPWPIATALMAGLWVSIEYLQATLFTGFGWSALAYSQGSVTSVAQFATLGGTGLVAFIVILFNLLLAQLFMRRWLAVVPAIILALVIYVGGVALFAQPESSGKKVGVVQSNFPQVMKWDREYTVEMVRNTVDKTRMLIDLADPDIVVWPEALVMRDPQGDLVLEEIIGNLTRDTDTHLIFGSVRDEPATGASYNSSFHVSPDGAISADKSYDKNHLAPFGEYIPLETMLPFLRGLVPAIGDVSHGVGTTLFDADGTMIAPLICFEVLFPNMAMHYRDQGAEAIAVVTNLGWFGASAAQGQELEMARYRAIETRLPLIHAANTGISGVFDPYGRFSPVYAWQYAPGQLREWPGEMPIAQAANYRMVGAFDLAAPAPHPFPAGPLWFPRVALVLTLLSMIIIALRSRSREAKDE